MMKLLTTAAVAALAFSSPVLAQEATQMISGPGVTCAPSTAATGAATGTETTASTTETTTTTTGTETTASTTAPATGAGASTMTLSADNQVNAQTARMGLSNSQTNVAKLSSLGTVTVVCIVDLDTVAQSDATLKDDISKYRSNTAQIKPALESNAGIISVIKAQHPTFDINQVIGTDIGPNGELVLYV